jgi:hypothetical protein
MTARVEEIAVSMAPLSVVAAGWAQLASARTAKIARIEITWIGFNLTS